MERPRPQPVLAIWRTHVDNDDDAGFPKLGAPARRALSAAGYTRLDQLAQVSERDLKKLHGVGPSAISALREALQERGLSFHSGDPASDRLEAAADRQRQFVSDASHELRSPLTTIRARGRSAIAMMPAAASHTRGWGARAPRDRACSMLAESTSNRASTSSARQAGQMARWASIRAWDAASTRRSRYAASSSLVRCGADAKSSLILC